MTTTCNHGFSYCEPCNHNVTKEPKTESEIYKELIDSQWAEIEMLRSIIKSYESKFKEIPKLRTVWREE